MCIHHGISNNNINNLSMQKKKNLSKQKITRRHTIKRNKQKAQQQYKDEK